MANAVSVPAMPVVDNFEPAAPGAGSISSTADVGQRAYYCTKLQLAKASGVNIDDSMLGEAVCIVTKAANVVNGGGEAAIGARVQQQLNEQKQQLNEQKQQLNEQKQQLKQLDSILFKQEKQELLLIRVESKLDNAVHRNWNAMSRCLEHPLQALKVEDVEARVGQYPREGLFPATLGDIAHLNTAALDALQTFYGRTFKGRSVAAQQNEFKCFIGAM